VTVSFLKHKGVYKIFRTES